MAGGSDGERSIIPIEIYSAGGYLFPNKIDVYILGYNRLLNYSNGFINKWIAGG